jgi:hypothetical protein
MNRRELAAAVAVGLYIVFFAMEPPAILRGVLDNVVGVGALFLAAAYVTIYQSKIVGGLLLLAVVLSGSRGGREGLVNPTWTPAKQTELDQVTATITQLRGMGLSPESNNALRDAIARQTTLNAEKTPASTPPPASSGSGWTPAKQTELDQVTATITQLRGMGLSPESNNALRDAIARQATLNAEKTPPPPATTPTPPASTTTPAASPGTTTVPAPTTSSTVASCNLENFSTLRRSLPQEYAAF